MTLNQDIEKLIAENLPLIAATSLQDFIVQAKADKIRLDKAETEMQLANEQIEDYRKKTATVEQTRRIMDKQIETNEAKEKQLAIIESNLVLLSHKLTADIAMAELKGVKETMAQFLRNPVVRTTVMENVAVPVTGSGHSMGFVHQGTQSSTKTEEQG